MLLPPLLVLLLQARGETRAALETAHEWRFVDFLWPSEAARTEAVRSGTYEYGSVLPMDVDVAPDGRVFLALLGQRGVPARLGTVSEQRGPSGPLVAPYPGWEWFRPGDCDAITSVYRIAIDECERLWVLDTGFLEGERIECQPQLLAFDLRSDRLLLRLRIPDGVARNADGTSPLPANPVVETSAADCAQVAVYVAETFGGGLVVWNGSSLYRLESPAFKADPQAAEVSVGGASLNLTAGLCGMDLSPRLFPGEARRLYFRPLASLGLFSLPTSALRHGAGQPGSGELRGYEGAPRVLSSQAVGQAFSAEGALFLGLTRETGVACWNRYRPLSADNFELVAQDAERLQYANGLKVVPPREAQVEEELWVLSNKFIAFQLGLLNETETNFRVLRAPVRHLVAGTRCELPPETRRALQAVRDKTGGALVVSD